MNFIEAMDLFKTGDLGDFGKVEDILESEDYIVELILKPDNYLGCEAFLFHLVKIIEFHRSTQNKGMTKFWIFKILRCWLKWLMNIL
ncbi:hypothetical protein CDG60_08845 [Acinetobacter chinensis]|uniref:Uncharacterized protein n=1 Tax=Acinetobacter chinensis TaxID=2004650 RepID=A0A3B7M237_9GAMM|nr:hypothetical protein CDG60_08845 [Acinetobacter chinensis]